MAASHASAASCRSRKATSRAFDVSAMAARNASAASWVLPSRRRSSARACREEVVAVQAAAGPELVDQGEPVLEPAPPARSPRRG